jgi:hypothetical protein
VVWNTQLHNDDDDDVYNVVLYIYTRQGYVGRREPSKGSMNLLSQTSKLNQSNKAWTIVHNMNCNASSLQMTTLSMFW